VTWFPGLRRFGVGWALRDARNTTTTCRWSRSCGPTTRSSRINSDRELRRPSQPNSDVPMHSERGSAVGHCRVGFAASQLSAMSVAPTRFGGPNGGGCELLRRDVGLCRCHTAVVRTRISFRHYPMSRCGRHGYDGDAAVPWMGWRSIRLATTAARPVLTTVCWPASKTPPQRRPPARAGCAATRTHLRGMRRRCIADLLDANGI